MVNKDSDELVWRGSSWKSSTNRWRGGPDNEMATICVVRRIPFTAQSTALIDFFWPHHLCLRCRPRTWLEWTVKQSVRVTVSIERRRSHTNVPEKRDLIPIHWRPDNLGQEFLFKCLVIWLLALPGLKNERQIHNVLDCGRALQRLLLYLQPVFLLLCTQSKKEAQLPNVAITVASGIPACMPPCTLTSVSNSVPYNCIGKLSWWR